MAEEQIKNEDLIEKDVFDNTIKDAMALLDVLKTLEKQFKDIIKITSNLAEQTPFAGYENINRIINAIKDFEQAQKGLLDTQSRIQQQEQQIEQQRERNHRAQGQRRQQQQQEQQRENQQNRQFQQRQQRQRRQQTQLTREELEEREKLARQRRQERAQIKAEIVLNDENAGIIEKLQAKNALLRIERSKLSDETRAGRRAIRRINKEINENTERIRENSSEIERNRLNIGNYAGDIRQVAGEIAGLTLGVIGLDKAFGGLNDSLNANQESSETLSVLTAKLNAIFDVTKNSVGEAANGVFDIVSAFISGEASGFGMLGAIDQITTSFDGFGEKITKATKAASDAAKQNIDFIKSARGLREELVLINGELEKQQLISGDTTISFDKQAAAAVRVAELQLQRASIQSKLAQSQLDITNQQISALSGLALEEVKLLSAQELSEKSNANINELLEQRSALTIELQEAQNELALNTIDNEKIIREVQRDRFERELDFAVEIFDVQKTLNERIVSSNKKTLEEQGVIVEKTKQLAEESFNDQIALVEGFLGKRSDLEALALEEDQKIVRERVRQLAADDVTLGRILEIIRERKTVLQDVADLETEVADRVKERADNELKAEQELAEFRQSVQVTLAEEELEFQKKQLFENENFSKLRLQQARKSLEELKKEQIKAEELRRDNLLSQEELLQDERQKIIEESEEKIRQIKNESLEEQKKIEKDAAVKINEERKNLFEKGADVISQIINKNSEKRLEKIDKEIDATQLRQQQLQELAAEGVEKTTENLAFEQKKQAELELKREREIQRQKKIELGLTALKVYASNVESGDKNPLGSTIADISVLTAFISSLPAFYEGTNEKTISEVLGKPHLPGKDGYMVRVDGSETILSPEKTREYHASIGRNELIQDKPIVHQYIDNKIMLSKLDGIAKAIESKPVYVGNDFDAFNKAMIEVWEAKNKRIRNHKKISL